jgi:hypothetical protein
MNTKENIQNNKDQYIKPFFPNDSAVIKRTDAAGNVKYYKPHSNDEIRTCGTDLETELMCLLEQIEVIERALNSEECLPFANTLTAARQYIENSIHEIFRYVNNNVGEINITTIHEFEIGSIYRWGQCVDAELKPTDEYEEKTTFDHDPELIDELKLIPPDKTEDIKTIARAIRNGHSIQFHIV